MNISTNKFDSLEAFIFNEGLQIQALSFFKDLDMMLIILNTKAVLRHKISLYPRLKNADVADLEQYQLISNGIDVHFTTLDEDLSLKGFLQEELRSMVNKDSLAA